MLHDPAKSMQLEWVPIQYARHLRKVPDCLSFFCSRALRASGGSSELDTGRFDFPGMAG
jgi:hypothetical protein